MINPFCVAPWTCAAAFFISTCAALSQVTNEAELAVLSNGAQIENCSTCSGGKEVGGLGGANDGAVTFNMGAQRAGLYPLTVYYNIGDDRALRITVNTNTVLDSIFFRTSPRDSNSDSSKTILVPLRAGNNVISFDDPRESGPDLDDIVLGASPVPSASISGRIKNGKWKSLANVEVSLSAFGLEMTTLTDARGLYQFPFLTRGNYYIRPKMSGFSFSPFESFCAATNSTRCNRSFAAEKSPFRHRKIYVMREGQWRIEYDLAHGTADIFHNRTLLISDAFAVARLPQTVTSMDYKSRKISRQPIHDAFGSGVKFVVESSKGRADKMIQTFCFYDGADFFLTDVTVSRKGGVASNYMSPLTTQTPSSFLSNGDNRALFVPFDNDKWTRYNAVPFGSAVTSYEVSALYNNASRTGLVIGSVDHDTWKTGIISVTTSNGLATLDAFGGIASTATRDVLPHGKISGQSIKSPRIFVGWFSDWRDGLDAYARANATVAPRRPWNGGPPFGWNSWGKLQFRLNFAKAMQVSDFFAKKLPNFKDNGVVYIGLDAGWNNLSNDQLKQFVAHCKANGQEAGIYFTPFAHWGGNDDSIVPGTQYKFKDLYLYANGRRESIDSGVALDPTHPGTKKLIADTIAGFKEAGFSYVKADFLTQGALEADRYFDPRVTTGIQAYNEGMRSVDQQLGNGIFLNESIAPLFPAQYANSRRIACDSFGAISEVEYTLNSLTYGWWLSKVYDFNDPDEIVLDGHAENENRARVTSAAITGNFISGDDFSNGGDAVGKKRAETFLTNAGINNVARMTKLFRPVEGNTGSHAANLFYLQNGMNGYLAALNYSQTATNWNVDLRRLGVATPEHLCATNLWTGVGQSVTNVLSISLHPTDAALFKLTIR